MKEPEPTHAIPPLEYFADFDSSYNAEIDELLSQILRPELNEVIQEFADSFYEHLGLRAEDVAIRGRQSPEEFEHLKEKQARHLHAVFDSGLTAEGQYAEALRIGRIHELIGVSLPVLLETYHLYHVKIVEIVDASVLAGLKARRLASALHRRLQLSMEAQIVSHTRFDLEMVAFLAAFDEAIRKASNLADMMQDCMEVLGDFDGISACLFSRPDGHGVMQIEAEGGAGGQVYAAALRSQHVPPLETPASKTAGMGAAGRAWRTGEIQVNNTFAPEEALQPWREEARAEGFRSSVGIPLKDQSGHSFAVLSLYSIWPGFFAAEARQGMLRHLQLAMSHAVLLYEQTRVIAADRSRAYRQCLEDGCIQMLYQPIVDLRTGKLQSVEALARLFGTEGEIITPAQFLPAFGSADLLRLFQIGLEQVCGDLHGWREREPDLDTTVAVNLPPDGLTQGAYRDAVFETLSRWKLPCSALTLEMLEDKETQDTGRRDARIAEFRKAGIRIAQDDLGSGFSSLLRMDRVPCDHVKIDQGLVRGTLQRPVRALEFIYHLTLLAQGFGAEVTVEGLEDAGLIEAATILGADHGQGYGIARPMAAEKVLDWRKGWNLPVDPERPRTALGALAGYLLWDHKLAMLAEWPELIANFIKEPWHVHRYLEHRGGSDPEFAAMLERTQILALQGQRSARYRQMRGELIERLGAIWIEER